MAIDWVLGVLIAMALLWLWTTAGGLDDDDGAI